jgi:4-hydroxy-tetrahydrodipicolinate reductase
MNVVVTGATGRTGGAVARLAAERGHEVFPVAPSGEYDLADLPALLAEADVDVLVDFSVPEASAEAIEACAAAEVPVVVGTTGFDEAGLAAIEEAAETVPVLKATNFARGVQALLGAVREAVAALPGYDVELTETHHNGKRDAPSGTAKTVLSVIEEGRGDLGERMYGREGDHLRDPAEVGVHVRRAGTVRGEHEVLLAGNDEVLTLTHRAESRGVFAAGALDAAEWLVGQDPALYDFADVIGGSQ